MPSTNDRIEVRCDCGTTKAVLLTNLLRNTRSCGCLRNERLVSRNREKLTKHGHCANGKSSPTYVVWVGMVKRCSSSPGMNGWANYGGRGITVCDRWHSFTNFLADMGERPEGTTLDRLDPNGNYEPSNCRWATPSEQQRTTRRALGLPGNPTVKQLLDAAGVPPEQTQAPRVAYVLDVLKANGIKLGT